MQRRSFFQRLGALIAGAAIVPHVKADEGGTDLREAAAQAEPARSDLVHTSGYSYTANTTTSSGTWTVTTWPSHGWDNFTGAPVTYGPPHSWNGR